MQPGSVAVAAGLLLAACTYNSSPAFVQPAAPPLLLHATTDPAPRDDGTVPRNARLIVQLDAYPDPDSVRYGRLTLRSGRGNFDIRLDVDMVGQAVVVTPRSLLDPDTQYELVAVGLASLDGRAQTTTQSFAIHAGSDAGTPPTAPPPPTWWGDGGVRAAIGGCAPACHSTTGASGRTRTPTRSLDLTGDPADPSFGLIGVQSVGLRGTPAALLRVAPGDPARSVLLRKLIGGNPQANSTNPPYPNMRVDGQRMPISLDTEQATTPVSDDTLRLVQAWIAAGAPVGTPP